MTRTNAGFGAAFALLLGVGVAAVFQTYAWEASVAWVSHSFEVIGHLNDIDRRFGDLEAAESNLVPGRTPETAAQYRNQLERIVPALADLRRLTHDNPAQERGSKTLQSLAARRVAELDSEPAIPKTGSRNETNIQASQVIRAMLTAEQGLLDTRMARQIAIASRARHLFEAACFLSFLLTLLAAWRAKGDNKIRAAEEKLLAVREAQYRQVVELAGDLIFRTDNLGRFTFCNNTALGILQLTEAEVIGRSFLKLVRADKRREAERFYGRQFVRRRPNSYFEFPVLDGHGRERWLGQNVQLLIDGDEVAGFQGIAREITAGKLAEFESRKALGFVERIANTTPGVLYVYDLDERRNIYSNREAAKVLGYDPEKLKESFGETTDCFHPDDLAAIRNHHEALRFAQDREIRRIEYRVLHAQGHWVWLASRDTPFERDDKGLVKRIVGIAHDVTARKSAQEKLTYQANFDALTGLANRHHFWTGVQAALRRIGMRHSAASLCILDVDHFREINERYGHEAADEVLEAMGEVIRSELRPRDVAGRLGGDDFGFLLPDTDVGEASRVAARICDRVNGLVFGAGRFSVTATLAIAEWKPDMDARDLLEDADRALHRAKESNRASLPVGAA